jgi:multidrug resistance efflux pump
MSDRSPDRRVPDPPPTTGLRVVPVLVTFAALALAALGGWAIWQAYVAAPWTRDGVVLAYVVTIAPEVSGRITRIPVRDNQLVHRGDLLLEIDPTDYAIAVARAQAAADQARLTATNAAREAQRRARLSNLTTSTEEQQSYETVAASDEAAARAADAALASAKVNLQRTRIVAPVNGYVTNLLTQEGDYANVGATAISLVNADSFWVYGYFEETNLPGIHVGDAATVKLMGFGATLSGHVASIARGISVANVQPSRAGLASVNPIFTWVRLAQRVPVRIAIDHVPPGVLLFVGETASVQVGK